MLFARFNKSSCSLSVFISILCLTDVFISGFIFCVVRFFVVSLLCHFADLIRTKPDEFTTLDPKVFACSVNVSPFALDADVVLIPQSLGNTWCCLAYSLKLKGCFQDA